MTRNCPECGHRANKHARRDSDGSLYCTACSCDYEEPASSAKTPYWYEGEPMFRYFKRSYESGDAAYYVTTCCRLGWANHWSDSGWMVDTMSRNEYGHSVEGANVREVRASDVPKDVRAKIEDALSEEHALIVAAGNCSPR